MPTLESLLSDPSRLFLSRPVLTGRERGFMLDALDSGWLAAGPHISAFEDALTDVTGAAHACSVLSVKER